MRAVLKCFLLFWLTVPVTATSQSQQRAARSKGTLSFRVQNKVYTADSTHARGYSVTHTAESFINGANSENMVINMEWKSSGAKGVYRITAGSGKADFTLQYKTYLLLQPGDYIKIEIRSAKKQDAFVLISGTFEGQLQDRNGHKIIITEGRFSTILL
jgi:hypothetical protein